MNEYDLLIVGSGPAAFSCAITARKRNLSVLICGAPSSQSWLARTESIENYPGMPHVSGQELLDTFRKQAEDAGAVYMTGTVRQIQQYGDFMALCGNEVIMAKAVVIATGAARPQMIPGEEENLGRGVSWCGTCDGMFYRGKKVAVVSYWDGGREEADFLSNLCAQVDYYTHVPHHLPENEKVTLCDGKITAIRKDETGLAVKVGEEEKNYDGVFIFRPSVRSEQLLPGLEMDGPFIRTDRRMATNIPLVYAAGDCAGKPLQVAKAVGEGNIAALSADEDMKKAGGAR